MSTAASSVFSTEGEILIHLGTDARVSIQSQRPIHASRVLVGKTPAEAMQIVPLLFNVCKIAQSLAATLALRAAKGRPDSPAPSQRILLQAETARETLLRLLRDTPTQLGLPLPDQPVFSSLTSLLQDFKRVLYDERSTFANDHESTESSIADASSVINSITALESYLQSHVFGVPCETFARLPKLCALQSWANEQDTLPAQAVRFIEAQGWSSSGASAKAPLPLPELPLGQVALRLTQDAAAAEPFIAQPQWNSQCYETGSYARQWNQPLVQELRRHSGSGLLARWAARLLELALIPANMRRYLKADTTRNDVTKAEETSAPCSQHAPVTGTGIASVEAARGRLMHLVQLDHRQTISAYRILAPTEWNFHPQGALARILTSLATPGAFGDKKARTRLAHLLVQSIDPCVAYRLEVA